ncbi:MAG TPA: MerR family transcriptional regulator [Candidatus Acidoferrales bacterium]|jgi:DNA-binding transcriptional MerR regulator|nr:MerR family transcriptional regulator [Candidatus Acidoferrales bacterium]HWF13922.1 MerR family transcriptional regulator [Candidatus Acidoferrales bacterium]
MEELENNGSGNGHGGALEAAIPGKELFRIGEVSRVTATKPFVLRYWETEFPMLQPVKSPKGHRLYRQEDIDTVFTIKRLLYNEGFTIAGARRHLRDQALGTGAGEGANGGLLANATPAMHANHGEEHAPPQAAPALSPHLAVFNRQTLLDLRDSLRSLLTALESE